MKSVTDLVREDGAIQDRSIFWDDEIYQGELENIFAKSWQFLTHDSLIPDPGDYEVTTIGEDNVIVARCQDGTIDAFINSCTHRGNTVCFAERGNTKTFTCPYHGWVFGLNGALEHVPLENIVYRDDIDRSQLGLAKVAKVESYKGFVFGTFDAGAPSLSEYLGEMAWYLDTFMDVPGGMQLIGPPMKSILGCNWKFMTENMFGDGYHVGWAHAAALEAVGEAAGPLAAAKGLNDFDLNSGMQITTDQGHGFGVIWEAAAALQGPVYKDWIDSRTATIKKQLGDWRARLAFLAVSVAILGFWLNVPFAAVDLAGLSHGVVPGGGEKAVLVLGVLLLSVAFGQIWCGYGCPFGALQELLWLIPHPRGIRAEAGLGGARTVSPGLEMRARYLKFGLLALVLCFFFISDNPAFLALDPMTAGFSRHLSGVVVVLWVVVGLASLIHLRPFCRYLCPAGAFLALSNKVAFLDRLARPRVVAHCDLGVTSRGHLDCIRCNRCLRSSGQAEAEGTET